jgi:xanthine dehydrogenase small subunit
VIGELHDDGVRYRAVNSCIQFLATLDGKQLVTVEDLTKADKQGKTELHTVQQAMLEQHGSQCGFCTPGFVMSLFAMFHEQAERDIVRTEIDLGLAGNLCRCTGYAPIVRAAEQALTAQRIDQFTENESHTIQQLASIQPVGSLQLSSEQGHFFAPHSVDELCELLIKHPKAFMVAGATDVGLWVTKHMRKLDSLIYLGAVEELKQIRLEGDELIIGAAVTYTDAIEVISEHFPAFLPLLERLGASQVRNAGTIGGNIANGSPIGDSPPGLIAADTRLVLRSKARLPPYGSRIVVEGSYQAPRTPRNFHGWDERRSLQAQGRQMYRRRCCRRRNCNDVLNARCRSDLRSIHCRQKVPSAS